MNLGEKRVAATLVSVVGLAILTLGVMLAIGDSTRLHGAEEAARQIAVDDAHLGLAPMSGSARERVRRRVPRPPCPGRT